MTSTWGSKAANVIRSFEEFKDPRIVTSVEVPRSRRATDSGFYTCLYIDLLSRVADTDCLMQIGFDLDDHDVKEMKANIEQEIVEASETPEEPLPSLLEHYISEKNLKIAAKKQKSLKAKK
jgi:hypothetical protein